jgi:hypothetical protein
VLELANQGVAKVGEMVLLMHNELHHSWVHANHEAIRVELKAKRHMQGDVELNWTLIYFIYVLLGRARQSEAEQGTEQSLRLRAAEPRAPFAASGRVPKQPQCDVMSASQLRKAHT